MDRVVLHSDLNNFYASVECLYRPDLREKPVAVGGDPELRHGIVLSKNYVAKRYGIITGETLLEARQKCRDLVVLPPSYRKYLRFSDRVRKIYGDYTDRVEPFGLDECWLDLTGSLDVLGLDGAAAADEIRRRIREELGITASIGVSFNKIFAKLGSDLKKPDATTPITRENYKSVVWPLPAGDLLYVGYATRRKLSAKNIRTIGDLASTDPLYLEAWFGKWGLVLHCFANGRDSSPVAEYGQEAVIKSVGNSTTAPRDLVDREDVKITLWALSESVAMRLREQGLSCGTVEIQVRDTALFSFVRQKKLPRPTSLASEILKAGMELFEAGYDWKKPIRSLGIRGCGLVPESFPEQYTLFEDPEKREKLLALEKTADQVRRRFGNLSLRRAATLVHRDLGDLDAKADHVIHPVGYF
ncbi:DNA polymerase Y family protein [Papillibacter cinnamivorans]|uniref:DNA polymerase IV n=1 Tax=Papillibacter cinnamivorans DSM 12816 TaxID=1122930 RepID=A0A1W1ZIY8_9FIRM|nr:DNA polymerase IV [Papillibacter cinnamivorans]SMC48346.1 DNA polymerase-4 [Papillibacter cinnamivorans DSM 12816]